MCISVIWGQYPVCLKSLPDFPGDSNSKESACNAGGTGDLSLIPGVGRSPGVGKGNPPQYSCLENPMDRGAGWAIVHGVAKSQSGLGKHICTAHPSATLSPGPPTPQVRAHGCWITGIVLSGCPPGSEIHIVRGGITDGCDISIYRYEINIPVLNIHLILQQTKNIRHILCARHCTFSRGYKHGKDEALMKSLWLLRNAQTHGCLWISTKCYLCNIIAGMVLKGLGDFWGK